MMAKLKIAGAWSGVLDVSLEDWTVPMLRQEVAKRSNCEPDSIKLICAGKLLKDDDDDDISNHQNLSKLGLKNNSKILASRVCKSHREELMEEEERASRLSRIKAATIAMSERHADGSLPIEDFNIELEDQSGSKVNLGSETDQRAVMMGLMLHSKSKKLIKLHKYIDALEVLTMAEEAFSLCNPKVIELVDNIPMMQIDIVWCYFMLRDIKWLSQAGVRIQKAKEGLERAHGKDAYRVRILQAGSFPELALYLRLELLEGVLAYYSGDFEKCRSALTSAQDKYLKLQVSDESLSLLLSMGYKERLSKRALKMSNQDVQMAIDFLIEEAVKKEEKKKEDKARRKEIMEQKSYGTTPLKKAVNLPKLKELVSIGFEKWLAAEALRRNENDTQKALDDLTNPESNATIQADIESRKRKRQKRGINNAIEEVVSMGFPRPLVAATVEAIGTNIEALLEILTQQLSDPSLAAAAAIPNNVDSSSSSSSSSTGLAAIPNNNDNTEDDHHPESSSSGTVVEEERDMEMEDELLREIESNDAVSDYDIDVTKEGEAINEYLALLDSSSSSSSSG